MPRCRQAWAPCYEALEDSIPSYSLFQGNHNLLTPATSSPTSSRPPTPLSEIDEDENHQNHQEDDDLWPWELDVPLSFSSRNWNFVNLKSLGKIQIPNLITINTNYDETLTENKAKVYDEDNLAQVLADTALEKA